MALATGRTPPRRHAVPTPQCLQAVAANGTRRLQQWNSIRWTSLELSFRSAGVALPPLRDAGPQKKFQLNKGLQRAMSEFIWRTLPPLKTFVELVRGQTPADYRPNKALLPSVLVLRCRGYDRLDDLIQIASEGVRVTTKSPLPRQRSFPRNHPSSSERISVLRKNIRKEQDLLRCIVVDSDIIQIWPELFVSPFGVVDKGDGDPRVTRLVIHDLSFPDGMSVNACTDMSDIPEAAFEHCSSIAREILRCQHRPTPTL